jgi:hypothetical protein
MPLRLSGIGILFVASLALAQYGDISDLKLLKPEDKIDSPSEPPPPGAIVLFDGKSLDNWVKKDGKTPAAWKITDGGALEVVASKGDILTKEKFDGNFKLHVEFRVPYMPKAKGQDRANSGIYVQGRYEVQVLDSYSLESKHDDCGAIYEVAPPLANACKAPTVWQSYNIEYQSPRCEDGKKVANARITVYHNGVKIHDNREIPRDFTRAGMKGDPCTPGPILLQDHGNLVQFRNIWLLRTN